ncbi:MAG TPA: type II CAAX endopeptidase family protein [Longilinea sp.]|nr:type II CAAX endopeptidase family protein [Longilinea sp.]
MPNPIWNTEQHRLRAVPRILLFLLLWGMLALGMVFVMSDILTPLVPADSVLMSTVGENGSFLFAELINPIGPLVATILSLLAASRLLDRRSVAEYGFHFNGRWFADLGAGLVIGTLLMMLVFIIELMTGMVQVTAVLQSNEAALSFGAGLLAGVILFICTGIYEEIFSRGYPLRNLAEGFNRKRLGSGTALVLGYIASSVIFGLLHIFNHYATPLALVNLVIAGLWLGLAYVLTGEMGLPIGLHIAWNFCEGNVFGFPVSGVHTLASVLAVQQQGPDLLTGGTFGPEGGLVSLLAMLVGCLLVLGWVQLSRGNVAWRTDLAVYHPAEESQPVPMPTEHQG